MSVESRRGCYVVRGIKQGGVRMGVNWRGFGPRVQECLISELVVDMFKNHYNCYSSRIISRA